MFTLLMKTKKVVINDRDLANQFINYLKNTITSETYDSDGLSLYDIWKPVATDNGDYALRFYEDEDRYDAGMVLMALGAFLALRDNSTDHQLINAEAPIPSNLELESRADGTVSLFSERRYYGTLITHASFLKEMRQAKTMTQTQVDPISEELNPLLDQFQEAKGKLEKQISHIPAGQNLIEDLTKAYTHFNSSKDKTLPAKAFKVACMQAISTARPELENAFGLDEDLANQLNTFAHIIMRIASLFTHAHFFSADPSLAARALDKFELEANASDTMGSRPA